MSIWLATSVCGFTHSVSANYTVDTWLVGHPNVPQLFIRVQTDGSKTPREVFTTVCEKLINQLESLHQEFTREWELRRITNTGEQGNLQGNGF
jgi:DNA-directed RNA polymerase II subunit RPB11